MQRGEGVIFAAHHRPVPGVRLGRAELRGVRLTLHPSFVAELKQWVTPRPAAGMPRLIQSQRRTTRGQLVLLASDLRLGSIKYLMRIYFQVY